jgi:hypothetical protein
VEHHIAELADRLAGSGLDPAEARREAERRFGDAGRYQAHLERSEHRRATMRRRTEAWDVLAGGVMRVGRTLRHHPGFALGVVLTLALGVGANATMFSILDRLFFQPPAHVVDHERVVRVMVERSFLGRLSRSSTIAFPDFLDFKEHVGFSSVAEFAGPYERTVGNGAEVSRARVMQTSHEMFALLGVSP